jgi:putative flavoprotein involved in K+ transport
VLGVTNVVWCTGFGHDFGWIHLPVFDEHGYTRCMSGASSSLNWAPACTSSACHSSTASRRHWAGLEGMPNTWPIR